MKERKKKPNAPCRDTTNGAPCKQHSVTGSAYCVAHLRRHSGHLFVLDYNDPESLRPGHERVSYCRACGAIKEGNNKNIVAEACPMRANRPGGEYPPSGFMPMRLQYRFMKPEPATLEAESALRTGVRKGPFFAYPAQPHQWRIVHLPSGEPVAAADSKAVALKFMKGVCKDGVELDHKDPMMMDRAARFHCHLAIRGLRDEGCARILGGMLTMDARKAYFRKNWQLGFCGSTEERFESWGPFWFRNSEHGIFLCSVEEGRQSPLFLAPSRDRAIAFAKAAARFDLEWWEDHVQGQGHQYSQEILECVARLLQEFPDVQCVNGRLLPSSMLPSVAVAPAQDSSSHQQELLLTISITFAVASK